MFRQHIIVALFVLLMGLILGHMLNSAPEFKDFLGDSLPTPALVGLAGVFLALAQLNFGLDRLYYGYNYQDSPYALWGILTTIISGITWALFLTRLNPQGLVQILAAALVIFLVPTLVSGLILNRKRKDISWRSGGWHEVEID